MVSNTKCPECGKDNALVLERPDFSPADVDHIILWWYCYSCRTDFKTLHAIGDSEKTFDVKEDSSYPW